MAITIKNNTVLKKYAINNNYFAAIKISKKTVASVIPVEFDISWSQVNGQIGSIKNGKIKTIEECCIIEEIRNEKYLIFGLRDQNKNRYYPISKEEFVLFYNFFFDENPVLTKKAYDVILNQDCKGIEE